jgi:C-terminal duplication domain of Friend of PRMT1
LDRFGAISKARKANWAPQTGRRGNKRSQESETTGTSNNKRGFSKRAGVSKRGARKAKPKMTADSLNDDLEQYMMKDTAFAKTKLDQDLDAYMKDASVTASK